jgi:hypothetical protein
VIWTVSAQQETTASTVSVPEIIKQNCILTDKWMVDHCPTFWQSLATYNRNIADQWNILLVSWWVTALKTQLDKEISNQVKSKLALVRSAPSTSELFMAEYGMYLNKLLRIYIEQSDDPSQVVSSFFRNTYFDQDQSGLGISKIKLYKNIPAQYDNSLVIAVDIRNYSLSTIDTIESLYCFSTINGQDYIYPIPVTNAFNKNSITTLVAPVSVKNSPLLDQYGTKNMYCTLVYTVGEQEYYTNRGTLQFIMKG